MSGDFYTVYHTLEFREIDDNNYTDEPVAKFIGQYGHELFTYSELCDFINKGKQLGFSDERYKRAREELKKEHDVFARMLPPDNIPFAY